MKYRVIEVRDNDEPTGREWEATYNPSIDSWGRVLSHRWRGTTSYPNGHDIPEHQGYGEEADNDTTYQTPKDTA